MYVWVQGSGSLDAELAAKNNSMCCYLRCFGCFNTTTKNYAEFSLTWKCAKQT